MLSESPGNTATSTHVVMGLMEIAVGADDKLDAHPVHIPSNRNSASWDLS